jgi:hypothetical protein
MMQTTESQDRYGLSLGSRCRRSRQFVNRLSPFTPARAVHCLRRRQVSGGARVDKRIIYLSVLKKAVPLQLEFGIKKGLFCAKSKN